MYHQRAQIWFCSNEKSSGGFSEFPNKVFYGILNGPSLFGCCRPLQQNNNIGKTEIDGELTSDKATSDHELLRGWTLNFKEYSVAEAKSILDPLFQQYWKDFCDARIDKTLEFYHPDAVLVEAGKSGIYGKDAIKQEKIRYNEHTGKAPMKVSNEKYQMTPDYIIYNADYEIPSGRSGTMTGKFSQIWKKTNDKYLILREEHIRQETLEFYHPDAVLVEAGKSGIYGKDAIKQEKIRFNEHTGKAPMKVSNEKYQMTPDYIIYNADYEIPSGRSGTMTGKFSQIWKKTNDKYLILREEYSGA
ncbi:unnamed protein product [Strongylus vulgaris]|uniref:DUF4440 domain-containing protein n=1 Tax=Strongylus vulgaris TaxID=40348 RepID=A0A3P7JP91_STRVU|nr:unnamed protein product [Strongylus vulgaris]